MRKEFILKALAEEVPFRELCSEFDISRKTGYKWLERFHERGFDGLVDGSHRPKTIPDRTSSETTLEIIRLRHDWSITVNATLAPTFADGSMGASQVAIQ